MSTWANTPQKVRFEWLPSPAEINTPAYFHWDIRNVKECYSTTSGSGQPELKSISGTAGPATNSFPYTGTSKWFCIDLQGKRYPPLENQFLEAKRIVEAPLTAPVVSIPSGTYDKEILVQVVAVPDIVFRYSLNNQQVTQSSAIFSQPLRLKKDTTLKVRGFRTGFNPSPTTTTNYKFELKPDVKQFEWLPAATEINVPAYFHWNIENVKECYSTTSGSAQHELKATSGVIGPATNSFAYVGVSKWYCYDLQGNRYPPQQDQFLEARRVVEAPLNVPELTPPAGAYLKFVDVSLKRQSGVKYQYSTTGTTVTTASPEFPAVLRLTKNTILNIRAERPGFNYAQLTGASYEIFDTEVVPPTISPAELSHQEQVEVVLRTTTPQATVRYTTNNSDVTSSSPLYTSPFILTRSATVKSKVFKPGMKESTQVAASFNIRVADVVITPHSGTNEQAVSVCLATSTADAAIRYTINGSDVTTDSALYSACFTLSSKTTLKVKAFKEGMSPSTQQSADFVIGVNGAVEYIYDNNGRLLRTESKN